MNKVEVALEKMGESVVEPLIAVLQDDDTDVRLTAVSILGKLGDTRAVEPLTIALKDDDWWVIRELAAEALGKLGDARAVESLIAALQDSHWFWPRGYPIRQTAAEALRRIGTPEALTAVVKYEEDEQLNFVDELNFLKKALAAIDRDEDGLNLVEEEALPDWLKDVQYIQTDQAGPSGVTPEPKAQEK